MKTYLILFIISCMLYSCNQTDAAKGSIQNNTNTALNETDSINQYWSDKNITSATLYCYYPEHDLDLDNLILDKNFNLHPTVIDSLTYELPNSMVDFLKKQIVNVTNFQESLMAACFDPHHGIVLKNDKEEIVGHISICFECNQFRLRPENVRYIPMEVFKKICTEAKVPTNRNDLMRIFYNSKK
jgi:hypothetical protein